MLNKLYASEPVPKDQTSILKTAVDVVESIGDVWLEDKLEFTESYQNRSIWKINKFYIIYIMRNVFKPFWQLIFLISVRCCRIKEFR